MDLDAARLTNVPRIPWTGSKGGTILPRNDAEKQARRKYCYDNRLCTYCEGAGHIKSDCAALKARQALQVNQADSPLTPAAGNA